MAGGCPRWLSPPEAEEEVDNISHLPDDIIHHIFSFLPFKDLVKTSALSKQWRFVWTSTPRFDISVPSADVVPSMISRALSLCTATKVEKFHIHVSTADFSIRPEVERWLHFAAAHEVEDASLDLGRWCCYAAPPVLCNCTSLFKSKDFPKFRDFDEEQLWRSEEISCGPLHFRRFGFNSVMSETEFDHEKSDPFGFDEKQFWHSQEFYRVANHLKRVEIVGFQFDNEQSELLLDLAKFLLEEAVGLEKMIMTLN